MAQDPSCFFHLGSNSKLVGDLEIEGPAHFQGHMKGNITAKDSYVRVEIGAHIEGELKAQKVSVMGDVTGRIEAEEYIEVMPTAKIKGQLIAPSIKTHAGAVIDGQSIIGEKS